MNFAPKEVNVSTKQFLGALILLKAIGVAFATLIFARFTPLVDSENYLNGSLVGDLAFRTAVVQWLATKLNAIGGRYFAHFAFALISVAGLAYYYISGGRRQVLVLTLLLPSSLVWTSIVGKEALFFAGMGLAIVIWSKYVVGEMEWYDMIVAALAIVACSSLRPHYAIALLWLFIAVAVLKKWKERAGPVIALILLLFASLIFYLMFPQDLLGRGYGNIDPSARASRFQMLGVAVGTEDGFRQFKSWIPLGLLIGIVGPLPSEVAKRVEFLPFFLEGVFILLAPLFVALIASQYKFIRKSEFFRFFGWCLVPAILMLMALHAPFGLLNPGSAIRWRTNFEQIFYLAPLLLFFRFLDNPHSENRSLPP